MTNEIMIDGINVINCEYFNSKYEGCHCYNTKQECYAINPDEHTSCKGVNCHYKQLKRKEQKLERITNMLFIGQCSNCEGYSPNCSNKELCNFKHNIKNIIDEVENE